MKKRHFFIVVLLIAIVAVLLLRQHFAGKVSSGETLMVQQVKVQQSNSISSLAPAVVPEAISSKVDLQKLDEERQRLVEQGKDEWRTPIEFYGKVVDEKEQPVEGAQINLSCNDLSAEGTSHYQKTSDSGGLFSINGIRGKLLTASVSKTGYYTSKQDNDSFYYAGKNQNFVPDFNNPIIFHLRKKGQAEPLIGMQKNFRVARDGTPLEIDLLAGKAVPAGQGHLRIECWTQDQGKKRGEKHDWQCRVSIPGGGMLENTNEFAFLAPANGYQESFEIVMPASLDREWKKDVQRELYFKLKDGKYGRMSFAMIAAGDHFCMIGALTNPSGSRNLEFNPAVQPKQTQFE